MPTLLQSQIENISRRNGIPATLEAFAEFAGAGYLVSWNWQTSRGLESMNRSFATLAEVRAFIDAYACDWNSHTVFLRMRSSSIVSDLLQVE